MTYTWRVASGSKRDRVAHAIPDERTVPMKALCGMPVSPRANPDQITIMRCWTCQKEARKHAED